MSNRSPLVDRRSFDDLVEQLETLLARETAWQPPKGRANMDRGGALVRLVARLAEIVLARVNRAPDKNFVAFLDMIGASLLPPTAARVPLTFNLSEGATEEPIVQSGTQVSAPIAAGSTQPVIFETQSDLPTTRTLLRHVYSLLPTSEKMTDDTAIATGAESGWFPVFHESPMQSTRIYSYLAIGAGRLVGGPPVYRYVVTIARAGGDWTTVIEEASWIYRAGPLAYDLYRTLGDDPGTFILEVDGPSSYELPPLPNVVDGKPAGWIVALLPTRSSAPEVTECTFTGVRFQLEINNNGEPDNSRGEPEIPPQAFANQTPIDLSRPFYPFGQEPQVGDCFYLDLGEMLPLSDRDDAAQTEIGSVYGVLEIGLNVELGISGEAGKSGVTLVWQYWSAEVQRWADLGRSAASPPPSTEEADDNPQNAPVPPAPEEGDENPYNFNDSTDAFTVIPPGKPSINFDCPEAPGLTRVMGLPGHWIRVLIQAGNYGIPATYTSEGDQGGYAYEGSTLHPPMIDKLTVFAKNTDWVQPLPEVDPGMVLIADTLHSVDVTADLQSEDPLPVHLYEPLPSQRPSLYLGFERSGSSVGFANRQVSIFFDVPSTALGADIAGAAAVAPEPATASANVQSSSDVRWEYCPGGDGWRLLGGQDGTFGFTRAGILSFLGPPDFQRSQWFGAKAFWLRAVLESGTSLAMLGRIATNSVMALNAQVVEGEPLGSSSAQPNQTFKTTRFPVLSGQKIDVREPSIGLGLAAAIEIMEGPGSVVPIGETGEYWVRWREVPDFYASGPSSRHYLFDHETGMVTFGDGQNGMIPPAGRNNVRAAQYLFGGGKAGNLPVGTISQLRTAIPGVVSAANLVAADGGTHGETLSEALARAPTKLRNRDRAVAPEDYVDLAFQAARNLARVQCQAASNAGDAGRVTLVVVPQSTARRPAPTSELLGQITQYMLQYMPAAVDPAKFSVIGPRWIPVDVRTDVVPVSPAAAADIQSAILAALDAFLNPISGGPGGNGWPFGELPLVSQVTAIVAGVPGVDHVRTLDVFAPGRRIETFMIFPGTHRVTMWSRADDQGTASPRRSPETDRTGGRA
jgi:hypothetical protein